MGSPVIFKPQPGFQEKCLSTPADVAFIGGNAGGGKSYALLLEAVRHVNKPNFHAVGFRRTTPQIRNPGGLWNTSEDIYPFAGGKPYENKLKWGFNSGATVQFKHLEHEKDKLNWQGSQITYAFFDELTHFSRTQFLYILTRLRSPKAKIKPYVRASLNPDPGSWVVDFVKWYIDLEGTGAVIPERSGVLRYFMVDGGHVIMKDSKLKVIERCPHLFNKNDTLQDKKNKVKSFTFIEGKLHENRILLENDPGYEANLLADETTRDQLYYGLWKYGKNNLDIFDDDKINDMFSNIIKDNDRKKYIVVDSARFGKDLLCVGVWDGYKCTKIILAKKSDGKLIKQLIDKERSRVGVPLSHVLIDQDSAMLTDVIGCKVFQGAASPFPTPRKTKKIKENFGNLRDQMHYKLAENVNKNNISINTDEVYMVSDNVSGSKIQLVKIFEIKKGRDSYTIPNLIKREFRSVKRNDKDDKNRINSKEEQKNMLNGQSPDLKDMFAMRMYFEYKKSFVAPS